MSSAFIYDNLIAYSLQIGLVVGLAAFIPTLLRLRQPGAKLVYWQILLAVCLVLPLQPWKQSVVTGRVDVTTVMTAVRPVHSASSHWPAMPPRSEMVLLLLAAGIVLRLGWLAAGFWKLRLYRRHSQPLEPPTSWSVEASLRISDEIVSPVTFGWLRPVVLLPANFPSLSADLREAILCHEILHIRRGDWLFTVAEELIRAIFWFHPAVWWLLGEIGLAREQEVDRLAIDITQQRDQYMDALLAIAGAGAAHLDLAPAPLFLRKRHLKHRVVLIVKEARMSKKQIFSTLAAAFAVLAMASWLVIGAFPLTAQPQLVSDAPGVAVNLNGASVIHRTSVDYPLAARQNNIRGLVSVEVKLDMSGNVQDARVLSGPDELHKPVLQSVLQWHFSHDVAGTTRTVQVVFDSQATTAPSVVAGAPNSVQVTAQAPGVSRGVIGGIVGSVPSGAVSINPIGSMPGRVSRVEVVGLPDQAKAELLATLPVHEGDALNEENMSKLDSAVRAFDEHLNVSGRVVINAGSPELVVVISAPGAAGIVRSIPTPPSPEGASSNSSQRIKVGGNVQGAMIIQKVAPVYPQLAKSARVSGIVQLAVIIAKDGTVQEIHSLGGPALLIQAAMDAVKQWIYKPTLLNGQPVQVETTVDVNFTLNE